MSRNPKLGTPGLVVRHLRSGVTASVLVAVLVAVTVLVVSLAPRALAQLSDDQLQHTLSELSPLKRDLTAAGVFGYPSAGGLAPTTADEMFRATAAVLNEVPDRISAPLGSAVDGSEWVIRTVQRSADETGPQPATIHPMLSLAVDLDWTSRVELVDGTAPAAWEGDESDGVDPLLRAPIDIALSAQTAEAADLVVGDILDYRPARLRVAGIYETREPDADFWVHALDLADGEPFRASDGELLVYASAYIDPESAVGLRDIFAAAKVASWYPVDSERLEFATALEARDQALQLMAIGRNLPSGEAIAFSSGLPSAIDGVVERVTLVSSLLALAVSGPIGVVLAVFALGVQSVIERRRSALSLASARGAGGRQLRSLMVIEGLLISIPAAALGIVAAGLLLPVPVGAEAFVLPVLLALAPPVLFAISTSPGSLRSSRADIAVRARGGVRWVLELTVIGLATLSLYLLFRRGLTESSLAVGVDPLLVATPLLLSLAVCLVVLRLYPALMLAVQRWTRTRRGAVGLVGAARAVRAPALGFSAALALVVGISIAVFSTVLGATVSSALAANAQQIVGADLRVSAVALDDELVAKVARIDGVDAVAGFERVSNITLAAGANQPTVTVVLADFDELSRVRGDLDLPIDRSGLTFLASDDLAKLMDGPVATIAGAEARLAGILPATAMPTVERAWILVDAADAETIGLEFHPQELLVNADDSTNREELASSIDAVVHDAQRSDDRDAVQTIDSSSLLAVANAEPVVAGLRFALLLAALTAVLLSMLAVVLASLSAGAVRNRLIGVLRILGMSPRQVNGLVAWELAPVAITAIVAGTALGLAELWIVTAALDLRPFLHGTVSPSPTVNPVLVAAVVVGFALVVALAGVVTTAIGRRFSPASSVKIGVE